MAVDQLFENNPPIRPRGNDWTFLLLFRGQECLAFFAQVLD